MRKPPTSNPTSHPTKPDLPPLGFTADQWAAVLTFIKRHTGADNMVDVDAMNAEAQANFVRFGRVVRPEGSAVPAEDSPKDGA